MKTKFLILPFLLFTYFSNAQKTSIEVAEISTKVPGLETLEYYYGFEEGDEISFSYTDLNNKKIKQVEIIEYPNNIKYAGYEVSSVDKKIKVNKRGIYLVRFTNSALSKREGTCKISRTPLSDKSINFDTNISWKEISDTTFTIINKKEIVGYDTTYSYLTKKELVKVDTIAHELLNKNEQVAALTSLGKPSESTLVITLPQNTVSPLETVEVISWAYWIGVGQEGHIAFEANKERYMKTLGTLANAMGNPLVGLALNKFAFLPTGNIGSNVAYFFMPDQSDAQIFLRSFDNGGFRYFDKGNGVSGYGRMEKPLQGTFFLGLHNDNYHNEIKVNVRVVAVMLRKRYVEKQHKQMAVTPKFEIKSYKQPSVSIKRVPVHNL